MELEEQKPKDIFLNEEIKQENENILENVKEEEYSEQIIPKLEEVIDPYSASTSYLPAQAINGINPVQKFFIQTQKAFPKVDTEPQKRPIIERGNRCCSVCSKTQSHFFVKTTAREFDKLVIMIGCILRGDYSLKDAQLFMSRKSHVGVCRKHFFDAIDEIFKFLDIKHLDEIGSCSVDFLKIMMIIVNAIIPKIKTSQFCDVLYGFALVNKSWKRTHSSTEPRCSVCTQVQRIDDMIHVSLQDEKLVIIIGCILRGDYSLDQAKLLIFEEKGLNICCSHLNESIYAIFSLLHIKSFEEFHTCSLNSMENVMATVNEVYPWVTIPYFRNVLWEFVERNKNHLNMTSTSSRIKSDEQNPEDILLNREIKEETEDFSEEIKEKRKEEKSTEQKMAEIKEEIDPCQPIIITESTENDQSQKCCNARCSVCLKLQNAEIMKFVTLEEEKLIIIIGCVLSADYSIAQAQKFMSRKIQSYICYTHFPKTFNEIFKCMAITNPHEMLSCSSELMKNVMVTVNSIDPHIEPLQFCNILSSFVKRNFVLNVSL